MSVRCVELIRVNLDVVAAAEVEIVVKETAGKFSISSPVRISISICHSAETPGRAQSRFFGNHFAYAAQSMVSGDVSLIAKLLRLVAGSTDCQSWCLPSLRLSVAFRARACLSSTQMTESLCCPAPIRLTCLLNRKFSGMLRVDRDNLQSPKARNRKSGSAGSRSVLIRQHKPNLRGLPVTTLPYFCRVCPPVTAVAIGFRASQYNSSRWQ